MEAVGIDLNTFRYAAVAFFSLAVFSVLFVYDQIAKQHIATTKASVVKAHVNKTKVVAHVNKVQPGKKQATRLVA